MDRIHIYPIEEGIKVQEQVAKFSINEAHCFDPNEEFKLRHLMIDIIGQSGTNVEETLKSLRLQEGQRHFPMFEQLATSTITSLKGKPKIVPGHDAASSYEV